MEIQDIHGGRTNMEKNERCLAIFLRGVDRLIEGSDTPKREITLDSLGHLAPPDSLWLNSFTLDNDGNE